MLIKDQIRARREAVGMSKKELADRIGVTEQAVRHWEDGRSYPGKGTMRDLEIALSFALDWTEGRGTNDRTAASLVDQEAVDLALTIARLPAEARNAFKSLTGLYLRALEEARQVGHIPGSIRTAAPPPANPKHSPGVTKARARAR